MRNAYSGSLRIGQWVIGKKIGSISEDNPYYVKLLILKYEIVKKNGNYHPMLMGIAESSLSSIFSTEASLGKNLTFSWVCFLISNNLNETFCISIVF